MGEILLLVNIYCLATPALAAACEFSVVAYAQLLSCVQLWGKNKSG